VTIDIAVLLSIGQHRASGRRCRADLDGRALEMALQLKPETRLHGIHAGNPEEPALADYLGMGLESLTVLRQPPGVDVFPVLVEHLVGLKPGLLLTGSAAEIGEGSGLLPYLLARRLGAALLPAIAEIVSLDEGYLDALQALPGGRRRRVRARWPCVATVDRAAPAPRQSAFAKARRGRIIVLDHPAGPPETLEARQIPARAKPRRLKIMTGLSAGERLRAATELQAGRSKLLIDPPPEEAARVIYEYLQAERIIQPNLPINPPPDTRSPGAGNEV
jgi:electron transfer flavoprotein beta subunit